MIAKNTRWRAYPCQTKFGNFLDVFNFHLRTFAIFEKEENQLVSM